LKKTKGAGGIKILRAESNGGVPQHNRAKPKKKKNDIFRCPSILQVLSVPDHKRKKIKKDRKKGGEE